MLELDDTDADTVDVLDEAADFESVSDEIVKDTFDHLGRSFWDENPRDPDDDL